MDGTLRGRSAGADGLSRSYFEHLDLAELRAAYPIGEAFLATYGGMSADELRQRQERQLQRCLAFAWKVPFYQRHWGAAGIEPQDIRGLDDIEKLPIYSKSDLMRSVEEHPPLGDFHGIEAHPAGDRPPLIFQTTSGTTGRPQPLICGPHGREVQAMLLARLYAFQGMTKRDVVHSVYGHGTVNGGHYIREAINHWIGAQLLTAGTGIETRSQAQVELMRHFRATVLVGFVDYLNRLASVAREAGLEPGRDLPVRMISGHLGAETREGLSEAWGGAQVYDWYGVGDTGAIAAEGPDRDGLYLMEDAQLVEVLDVASGRPLADGEAGDLVCTSLYKWDLYPIIRFNTHDVTRLGTGGNPFKLPFRKMAGFLGRSDNMVKLRGINVFPQGIGTILAGRFPETNGEFVCRAFTAEGRDEMVVLVEVAQATDALKSAMESVLRERLGVAVAVEPVAPGATAPLTGLESRQKPTRLIDERKP